MKTVLKIYSIVLLLALFVSLLLAIGITPPDVLKGVLDDIGGATRAFLYTLLLTILTLIVLIYRIPAEIDKEKADEIVKANQTIAQHEDNAKPKLEISSDESEDASHQRWDTNLYDFRVMVKNIGGVQLKDVKVKIKTTNPATLPFFPIELSIMHDDANLLNPGDSWRANVLETRPESNKLHFCEREDKFRNYEYPFQYYEILITASADNSPVIEKWFRFIYDQSNTQQPFTLEELNRDAIAK